MTLRALLLPSLAVFMLHAGCSAPANKPANGKGSAAEAKPDAKASGTSDASKKTKASAASKGGKFLESAPIAWPKVLRATPAQVEAVLGAHTREGGGRVSCVRFVPKRTTFSCTHVTRDYAHPDFEKIVVQYEDGKAAAVELVGFVQGDGDFSKEQALALAGVQTARAPRPQPADGAEVWVWFNHQAQLLVGKDQFLLRMSSVDKDWRKTKLEVIFNGPLSPEEIARVKDRPGDATGTSAAAPPPQNVLQ